MADVQTENGYTKIANDLLEQMALTKLSPIQFRIIFVIWRYTYGFSRKEHRFSLSFLQKATNYDQRQLRRELTKLEQLNIIFQNVENGKSRTIKFNKDFDKWGKTTSGKSTHGKTTSGKSIKGNEGKVTQGLGGNPTQEERNKEKLKETNTVQSLLKKMESFNDLSGKAGVVVGFMNQKYPDRKRFGIKGNITANDVFTKYLKDGFSAERLLVAIDQSDEELSPWDAVEKSRVVVTESQLKAERLRDLWDTYHLGEDYYKEFGDINEYNRAVEELKHLGQL